MVLSEGMTLAGWVGDRAERDVFRWTDHEVGFV